MQLSDFTTDPATGYLDINDDHWTPCDGTCGEVFSRREAKHYLTRFGDELFCEDCHPRCTADPKCNAPRLDGGEGGCAVHELDAWTEALRDDPTDAEAKRMIAMIGNQ